LFFGQTNVSNSDTKAEHLLQLEFDGGFQLSNFGFQIFSVVDEKREFTDLNPDYTGPMAKTPDRGAFTTSDENLSNMWGFVRPHPVGYTDPNSGKFVRVKEMIPELVVPDLTGFELGPYVSFRTDVEIEKRQRKYEELVAKKGSQEEADKAASPDQRWPPPRLDAKTLFDLYYAEKIRETYVRREEKEAKQSRWKGESSE